MKQYYLEGVLSCERMYQSGFTFTELYAYIGEAEISTEVKIPTFAYLLDFKEGFIAAISHFERLEVVS